MNSEKYIWRLISVKELFRRPGVFGSYPSTETNMYFTFDKLSCKIYARINDITGEKGSNVMMGTNPISLQGDFMSVLFSCPKAR